MSTLRDQIAETVARWALMYPLANWPHWGNLATADGRKHLDAIATKLAEAWGSDIAERALAVVQPALDAKDAEIERLGREVVDLRDELATMTADRDAKHDEAAEHAVARDVAELRAEDAEAALAVKDAEIARLRERWESSQLHVHEQIDRAEKAEGRLAELEKGGGNG